MKKGLFVLLLVCTFLITACGTSKYKPSNDALAEELLQQYLEGVLESNPDKIVGVMPDFIQEDYKAKYNQGFLSDYIKELKTTYGEDLKGTLSMGEEKPATDEELNGIISFLSSYEESITPRKCFIVDGAFHLEGSVKAEDLKFNGSVARCNFDGAWRLVIG